jgi:hypothetical protein
MTKIDSASFYTALSVNLAAARDAIKLATDQDVSFHIHSGSFTHNPTINITNNKYGTSEKVDVEGFSLDDLVNEFIRRARFATAQSNLHLGPPQIEGDAQ